MNKEIIYVVSNGYINKHGFQEFDIVGVFYNKKRALKLCEEIIKPEVDAGETVEFYDNPKTGYCSWVAKGWDIVTICSLEEYKIKDYNEE